MMIRYVKGVPIAMAIERFWGANPKSAPQKKREIFIFETHSYLKFFGGLDA